MTKKLIALTGIIGFTSALAWADKPEWAGQGAKPTDQQIEDHRNEMRDKNKDKPGKDGEQIGQGPKGEKEKNAKKSKKKHQKKSQGENSDSRGRDYSDRDAEG